ncbi:hypothetical protein P3342_006902 [Pyrenophora teres f. teres]|nr:hypothetical protein P3342_006902 [Pyrenophora teres f. teres]
MPHQPKNTHESGARVAKVTTKRQPRRKAPPPPPPPPTTHWSKATRQMLNFGPPVKFEDDWQPPPPAPAPWPQPFGPYTQGPSPGQAHNGYSQQNIQPGYYIEQQPSAYLGLQSSQSPFTAPSQQPYQQVQSTPNVFAAPQQHTYQQGQSTLNNFAASPQQQYNHGQGPQMVFAAPPQLIYAQGQGTQMSFTAQMQPQCTGVYQTQMNFAARPQQQQYPQIQGISNTVAAPPQQQHQTPPVQMQEVLHTVPTPQGPDPSLSAKKAPNLFGFDMDTFEQEFQLKYGEPWGQHDPELAPDNSAAGHDLSWSPFQADGVDLTGVNMVDVTDMGTVEPLGLAGALTSSDAVDTQNASMLDAYLPTTATTTTTTAVYENGEDLSDSQIAQLQLFIGD